MLLYGISLFSNHVPHIDCRVLSIYHVTHFRLFGRFTFPEVFIMMCLLAKIICAVMLYNSLKAEICFKVTPPPKMYKMWSQPIC